MDEKGWRVRFNLSTSTKGIRNPEFTIEGINQSDEDTRAKVKEWDKWTTENYPVEVVK